MPEGWVLEQPKKQPPGGALSEAERARNRAGNTVRVKVEQGDCGFRVILCLGVLIGVVWGVMGVWWSW